PSTGFYHLLNLPTSLEALPLLAFPLPRAPVSEARKSEILASRTGTCKRYLKFVQGAFSMRAALSTTGA
ncbi:hypothetical protein, partial [Paraburkholderia metrosideri]|uniref:hypothetical protein n=1 Tax=Paraburkholderia metrosideri TaxID=580937 RepID=UPI001F25784D